MRKNSNCIKKTEPRKQCCNNCDKPGHNARICNVNSNISGSKNSVSFELIFCVVIELFNKWL